MSSPSKLELGQSWRLQRGRKVIKYDPRARRCQGEVQCGFRDHYIQAYAQNSRCRDMSTLPNEA